MVKLENREVGDENGVVGVLDRLAGAWSVPPASDPSCTFRWSVVACLMADYWTSGWVLLGGRETESDCILYTGLGSGWGLENTRLQWEG